MRIGPVIALIYKEFLAVWRDKKSRLILVLPPILQLIIFSYAATLEVKNVSIAILNQDEGAESIEFLQRFHGSPVFNKIVYVHSLTEIKELIDNQEVLLVIHLNEQFSRNIKVHRTPEVQLILDGRKSNTAQIVHGYALAIVDQFNHDLAKKAGIKGSYTRLFARNWFNPNLLYYWFNVPNLSGVLTMLIALTITGLSIARERELGTFDQLLISPLHPIEILIGKTFPALLISLLEGSLIIGAAVFIFDISFTGSIGLLYSGLLVFILSIIGIGLFISVLSQTQQQAILGSFVFMTPAVLLSGYATPVENMPNWLQTVTLFNPLRYYLLIVKGVFLKNMPASVVFDNIWPMIAIGCFTLLNAVWFFRRRLS
jgi:ABC-2 type transport system permease protein